MDEVLLWGCWTAEQFLGPCLCSVKFLSVDAAGRGHGEVRSFNSLATDEFHTSSVTGVTYSADQLQDFVVWIFSN